MTIPSYTLQGQNAADETLIERAVTVEAAVQTMKRPGIASVLVRDQYGQEVATFYRATPLVLFMDAMEQLEALDISLRLNSVRF